jgi:hypothetical protein
MLANIDNMCAERDRLKKTQPARETGTWRGAPLKYFGDTGDQPPAVLKALAEVRRIGVHEGWRYHHAKAIIVAIPSIADEVDGSRSRHLGAKV